MDKGCQRRDELTGGGRWALTTAAVRRPTARASAAHVSGARGTMAGITDSICLDGRDLVSP